MTSRSQFALRNCCRQRSHGKERRIIYGTNPRKLLPLIPLAFASQIAAIKLNFFNFWTSQLYLKNDKTIVVARLLNFQRTKPNNAIIKALFFSAFCFFHSEFSRKDRLYGSAGSFSARNVAIFCRGVRNRELSTRTALKEDPGMNRNYNLPFRVTWAAFPHIPRTRRKSVRARPTNRWRSATIYDAWKAISSSPTNSPSYPVSNLWQLNLQYWIDEFFC